MDTETPTALAAKAGISVPYASQLISGARSPSLGVALHIYQRSGRKFGPLVDMPAESIDAMAHLAEAPRARGSAAVAA